MDGSVLELGRSNRASAKIPAEPPKRTRAANECLLVWATTSGKDAPRVRQYAPPAASPYAASRSHSAASADALPSSVRVDDRAIARREHAGILESVIVKRALDPVKYRGSRIGSDTKDPPELLEIDAAERAVADVR